VSVMGTKLRFFTCPLYVRRLGHENWDFLRYQKNLSRLLDIECNKAWMVLLNLRPEIKNFVGS
jgi:hypothetical protein